MQEILAKWDLTAAVIGEVIAEPVYRVTEGDRVVAEFPGIRLVTDCPTYEPDARESDDISAPSRARRARDRRAAGGARPALDARASCCRRRRSPASAGSIRQYDHDRAHEHRVGPGGDAAVVRIRGTDRAHRAEDRLQRPLRLPRSARRRRASPSPKRRATWRAPAGARWRSRTTSTSATRSGPEVYFQFREAVGGMARSVRGARHAGHGRQRLALQRESLAARCIPRPSSAWWDSSSRLDSRHARARSRVPGDAIVLLGDRTRTSSAGASISRASTAWWRAARRAAISRASRRLIDALLDAIREGAVARRTTAPTAACRRAGGVRHGGPLERRPARRSISAAGAPCRGARCSSVRRRDASSSPPPDPAAVLATAARTACRRA